MAVNSGKADNAVPAIGADAVDLRALLSDAGEDDLTADNVMLSATDETIALLNSAFAGDLQGVDLFSGWNFATFA